MPSAEPRLVPEQRGLSASFAARKVVQQHGHRLVREHLEVAAAIVAPVAVTVMHDLTRVQGAPQPLFAEGVVLAASRLGIGAAAGRERHGFPFCCQGIRRGVELGAPTCPATANPWSRCPRR